MAPPDSRRDKYATLDQLTEKGRTVLIEFFLLVLIISLFFALGLLHSRLGGFDTLSGAAVGAFILFAFFSPVIDWLLSLFYKARRSPWFNSLAGVVRLGRLAFTLAASVGLIALFLKEGSWAALKRALLAILDALTS